MTDPYSPYQPPVGYAGYPQGAYPQQPAGLPVPGIAKAAAIMMAVIGAGILLFSVLVVVVLAVMPMEMMEETGAFDELPPEVDPQMAITMGAVCIGACGGAFGLLYLIFSPFVWRGRRGSTLVAAVVAGMTLALALGLAVLTLSQGAPQAAAGAMIYFLGAAVMGVLLFLLIRAAAAVRQRDLAAAAAYQMWQGYYQQQQMSPPAPQSPPPESPRGSGSEENQR